MSALTSIWTSSEHQKLLNALSGAAHEPKLENLRRPVLNTTVQSTQYHSSEQSSDIEKAIRTSRHISSPSVSEKTSSKNNDDLTFDLYPALLSSPTFQSLSLAYSPSAIITTEINSRSSSAPTSAIINIDDHSKPETLLARLIIALSAMRRLTARRGWVTSIASGTLKFKVGPDAGEDMARKLLGYQEGMLMIE